MLKWLTENIEVIAMIGVVAVLCLLNCLGKREPKRDLKSAEYKTLDRRFQDAYKRAVFGKDEE